jgi:peptidoglycan/LPS O-acetylase OafA/YrhL
MQLGRVLMWIAAVSAAVAAVVSISSVVNADGTTKMVETWRTYGLAVFAGLFVLLALNSTRYRGLWPLVIANKLALTLTAIAYAARGGIADTAAVISGDGALTVLLLAAYVACRGWSETWVGRGGRAAATPDGGHPAEHE